MMLMSLSSVCPLSNLLSDRRTGRNQSTDQMPVLNNLSVGRGVVLGVVCLLCPGTHILKYHSSTSTMKAHIKSQHKHINMEELEPNTPGDKKRQTKILVQSFFFISEGLKLKTMEWGPP